jgi:hypothetical protein
MKPKLTRSARSGIFWTLFLPELPCLCGRAGGVIETGTFATTRRNLADAAQVSSSPSSCRRISRSRRRSADGLRPIAQRSRASSSNDAWCKAAGFARTEVVPLTGPASAAIAYKAS